MVEFSRPISGDVWYFKEDIGSIFEENCLHNVSPEKVEQLAWLLDNMRGDWRWTCANSCDWVGWPQQATIETLIDSRVILCTRLTSRSDALIYRLSRPASVLTDFPTLQL